MFPWRSRRVEGPLRNLNMLRQSLLMAELSCLAYEDLIAVTVEADKIGFPNTLFMSHEGAQAYVLTNEHDIVAVVRGTQKRDVEDLRADVNVPMVIAETVGLVHRGFKKQSNAVWTDIAKYIMQNTSREVWMAGHSLGAAVATICAGRCEYFLEKEVEALFTFGSPRIGDKRYVNKVELNHYRWVNNNDIVPKLPPVSMGYRHTCPPLYIDSDGKLHDMTVLQGLKDWAKGIMDGAKAGEIDQLADHSMTRYIDVIAGMQGL